MSEASSGQKVGHDPEEKRGILVIAHGSRDERWVQLIDDAVATVQTPMPVTVGYLELVEGRSIADGVRHMEKQGVQQLHVLPFFVCSGSTHLDEIRYALGLQKQPAQETDLDPVHPQLQIIWESPMDDHPYMVDILEERINRLSVRPEEEAVLLVVHGSDQPGFQSIWERTFQRAADKLTERFDPPFAAIDYGTFLPPTLASKAQALRTRHERLIVIPVFISAGYFTTTKIPAALEGIDYVYDGETYLPHPLVYRWLQEQADHLDQARL